MSYKIDKYKIFYYHPFELIEAEVAVDGHDPIYCILDLNNEAAGIRSFSKEYCEAERQSLGSDPYDFEVHLLSEEDREELAKELKMYHEKFSHEYVLDQWMIPTKKYVVIEICERAVLSVTERKVLEPAIEHANHLLEKHAEACNVELEEEKNAYGHEWQPAAKESTCAWANWRGQHWDAHVIEVDSYEGEIL